MNSGGNNEEPKPWDWDQWVDQHAPALLLFARQQARCEADAQDIVQEAILDSWRRTDGQPPPPALVFATIRRRAIDWARRHDRREARETASAGQQPACWFDASLEERERQAILESALKQLPEIYREVITLKLWGGLSFAEVATALGIPANTAASRYRYGLEELRRLTKGVLV